MKRRSFFGVSLALLASVPALAQSLKLPKREPLGLHQRYLYIEVSKFDGWNVKKDRFRIKANRFPVGTKEHHTWEYTIPYRLAQHADYIAVVGGMPLKQRNSPLCMEILTPGYMMSAPLRDGDWLIENGYRVSRNESSTSIG